MIGPNFSNELEKAGLMGLPFTWGDDGSIQGKERLTPDQQTKLQAVIDAHDSSKANPQDEINRLEALETPTRIADATLGDADAIKWLTANRALIGAQRELLK